ncbi:MAG: hypothetical protein JKY17_04200 [Magnetovibrio sp.]|nr:hypothetical protein [Magnetovibrio sp.]
MKVWQHVSNIDHLRRRAEIQIERARLGRKVSFAAGGNDAPLNDETKAGDRQSEETVAPK